MKVEFFLSPIVLQKYVHCIVFSPQNVSQGIVGITGYYLISSRCFDYWELMFSNNTCIHLFLGNI